MGDQVLLQLAQENPGSVFWLGHIVGHDTGPEQVLDSRAGDFGPNRYDATLSACRARLGPERFASASERGYALSWERAARTALEMLSSLRTG